MRIIHRHENNYYSIIAPYKNCDGRDYSHVDEPSNFENIVTTRLCPDLSLIPSNEYFINGTYSSEHRVIVSLNIEKCIASET